MVAATVLHYSRPSLGVKIGGILCHCTYFNGLCVSGAIAALQGWYRGLVLVSVGGLVRVSNA